MGTVAHGGKGFKARAAVSGESPIGAASFRQQHHGIMPLPPPPIFIQADPGGSTFI